MLICNSYVSLFTHLLIRIFLILHLTIALRTRYTRCDRGYLILALYLAIQVTPAVHIHSNLNEAEIRSLTQFNCYFFCFWDIYFTRYHGQSKSPGRVISNAKVGTYLASETHMDGIYDFL